MATQEVKCWHFLNSDRRLGYWDGRLVEVGKTLSVSCRPVLCKAGLHGSRRLLDALGYASSNILSEVIISGDIVEGDDKLVGEHRKVLRIANIEEQLRRFARECALDVIHLWKAPQVVIDYLNTGREDIRKAAWNTATGNAAAGNAAMAARKAARKAARNDAWIAAKNAAWAADRAAAARAARNAAWNDAWNDAREKQNKRLTNLIETVRWEY